MLHLNYQYFCASDQNIVYDLRLEFLLDPQDQLEVVVEVRVVVRVVGLA
jgi:hypothetical protein